MDKILSIRSNKQITSLLIEIQEYQEAANRTEIVNWALEKALEQKVEWRSFSNITINEVMGELKQPEFIQIRVNKKNYEEIEEEIKDYFKLKRVTAPYLIKLILLNYLGYLTKLRDNEDKESIITAKKMVDFGIDGLVFKNSYELSNDTNKEKLLEVVRKYLEVYDKDLNEKIRFQMNQKIKQYSDFFNINRYSTKPRSTFGTCNIRFVSKVFAGLLITMAEIEEYEIKEIINTLESIMN